jgi:small subunit ribosomal protein S19
MTRVKKEVEEIKQKKIRFDFSLKGKSLEELVQLSYSELASLLKARARRKILRGLKPLELLLLFKLKIRDQINTRCRSMIVLPEMVGKTIGVYNGKVYKKVDIVPEMIGRYLGQFSLTRKLVRYQKKAKKEAVKKPKK